MTTGGEGGICVTDDEEIFKKMWGYKDHGRDYRLCTDRSIKWKPGYRNLCTGLGTNYRMTEMQAVIGRIFLKRELFGYPARCACRRLAAYPALTPRPQRSRRMGHEEAC